MRVVVVMLLLCPALCAAQYEISRSVIAGGGGTSSDGTWRVTGTVGQAEADLAPLCSDDGTVPGLCAGASYTLMGGFWWANKGEGAPSSCGADLQCLFRDGFEQGN